MTNELEARLISFVKIVAKGCDICPHRNSSTCIGCYGQQAHTLLLDIDFKPWNNERDEKDMTILAKLDEQKFMKFVSVALDCDMSIGVFTRAAGRLAKLGIVEIKDRWIRKKKTK